MNRTLGSLVVSGLVLWMLALHALADSGVAEKLFREGKRLMGEGNFAEACKAFEGSFRQDHSVSTLLNLGDCREKNQQYASAWSHFLDAERSARATGQASLVGIAQQRASKLEERLSYLIINVPRAAHVVGLTISRNGVAVDEAEWNVDIPVDGGEYVIEGKAPGYEAWSTRVTVAPAKDKQSVNVPRFRERPTSRAREPEPTSLPAPALVDSPASRPRHRRIALTTLAGGGAFLVGGLVVGYLAQQRWADAKAACGADLFCDTMEDRRRGQDHVDAARLRGNVSTALVGVGVAAIAVGAVIWLRAPSARTPHRPTALYVVPTTTTAGGGIVVGGSL